MTTFNGANGGLPVIGPYPDDPEVFSFSVTESSVVAVTEQVVTNVSLDAEIETVTAAITDNRFTVDVASPYSYTIQSTANGSVSGNVVSRVQDGTADIIVRFPYIRKGERVTFARTGGGVTQRLGGWVMGSLARHCSDQIDGRLAGGEVPAFTTRDTVNGIYVRNQACWASDIDMTAIVANEPGVAITPRHVLVAWHFPGTGDLHFVDNESHTVVRQRSAVTRVGSEDMAIITLNEDLPEEITPLKILPPDIADYLPSPQWKIPAFASNQFRDCAVKDLNSWAGGNGSTYTASSVPLRIPFGRNIISGDSSSPVCLVVNNRLVVATVWSFSGSGGYGAGFGPYTQISAINAITSQAGHFLSTADLTEFTNYG